MKKQTFCTIVTKSHIPWALALNSSIIEFDCNATMFILVTDVDIIHNDYLIEFPNTTIIYLKDIENIKYGKQIIEKYSNQSDCMRWSLKPILVSYLIGKEYDKILYCDCDIHFYNDYNFLWEELNNNDVLITPHWMNHQDPSNIAFIHRLGLFNGGFIGVSKKAHKVMEWWAKLCLYKCVHSLNHVDGDQGYLDLLPVYFDNVKILNHKGCNIAYWNADYLERIKENGNYFIKFNDCKYPIIFYHFGSSRYSQFLESPDNIFLGILEKLNESLHKYGYSKNIISIAEKQLKEKNKNNRSILTLFKSFLGKKIPYRVYKKE